MGSNIEVKARLSRDQAERVRVVALSRSTGAPETFWQRDTFYQVPSGRLKLREFQDGTAELIAYERPDRAGPKESRYVLHPCPNPQGLREVLGRSLSIRGVVEKRRELIHISQTRVHLDDVLGLGLFLELEVVLGDGQAPEEGTAIALELMQALGVPEDCLLQGAYIDLLEATLPA